MTTASPSFSFSGGGAPLVKKVVAATTSFTATLDDLTGINTVSWSIVATDETTLPANYTLTPSGAKGSVVTITSLALGTAALLSCTINGGIDPVTAKPSAAMSATALFEVLLINGGSVGVVGETTQRDAVFGSLVYLNQMARQLDATATALGTPVVAPTPDTVPLRGSSGELKGVRFETGTGSAQSGTVRLPDGASISVRTSDTLSDSNLISQTTEALTVGDTPYTASISVLAKAGGTITTKVGTGTKIQLGANGIGLLSALDSGSGVGVVSIYQATTAPTVPPNKGFIIYVDPTSNDLMALSASGALRTIALF